MLSSANYFQGIGLLPSAPKRDKVEHSDYLVSISATLLQNITKGRAGIYEDQELLIQEIRKIYRDSRVSYSVLLVALVYLLRFIQTGNGTQDAELFALLRSTNRFRSLGGRMIAVSLVLACKFLQDKNASNEAWAGLASCSLTDFNAAEELFLRAIDYRVWVTKAVFDRWTCLLFSQSQPLSTNQRCKRRRQ